MLLTGRCASLLLDSAHQEQVALMMPPGPKGAAANKLAVASGIHGGPEALPSVCAHLSGCTGLGCVGAWGQGGSLSCHPSLSLCLSIHLSTPLTDQGQGGDRQTQDLLSQRPCLNGGGIKYQGFTPRRDTAELGPSWRSGQGPGGSL